jgi:hypothetical protein
MADGRLFNQVMIAAKGMPLNITYRLPYNYQSQFKDAQRNAQNRPNSVYGHPLPVMVSMAWSPMP